MATTLALHLKTTHKTLLKPLPNLTFSHLFSSSSSDNNNNDDNPSQKPTNLSSYLSDVKSRLRNQQPQNPRKSFNLSLNVSKSAPEEEINRNLSEFRKRYAVSPENPNALDDILKRSSLNPNPNSVTRDTSFASIRDSLRKLKQTSKNQKDSVTERLSLNKYKENFGPNPSVDRKVIGGSLDSLPLNVFGKEMKAGVQGKEGNVGGGDEDPMMLIKDYSYQDLGKLLRELRPKKAAAEEASEGWFSLAELSERLKKLKEIETQKSGSGFAVSFRSSMAKIKSDKNNTAVQKLFLLGGTQSIKFSSPKEHLIEKYFHPDNMSSAEKLKIELKKVRDEFKIHESDCGSARVQIAQLTTEILHLSSVLHKKDKHSRRGLLAKVQQRKKLLKYLRRTDWDSYCFVLSKLGLRDNPNYKN